MEIILRRLGYSAELRHQSRALEHIITTLAKQANVTTESGNQVSAHKLRHTFATTLYNKNPKVDVLILGSLLGHSDPNSTKIYTQISKDVMRDVLETDLYNMDNK